MYQNTKNGTLYNGNSENSCTLKHAALGLDLSPAGVVQFGLLMLAESFSLIATQQPVTLDGMAAQRPRLIFDCTEEIRLAVRIKAIRTSKSVSDIITAALMQYMGDEIEDAKREIDEGGAPPKSRRGRPKKDRS